MGFFKNLFSKKPKQSPAHIGLTASSNHSEPDKVNIYLDEISPETKAYYAQIDEYLLPAIIMTVTLGYLSVTAIQRRFNIGYPRASCVADKLIRLSIVEKNEMGKPQICSVKESDLLTLIDSLSLEELIAEMHAPSCLQHFNQPGKLVNIQDFVKTYLEGASMPDDLFDRLTGLELEGYTTAFVTNLEIYQCERRLMEHRRSLAALFTTCGNNNLGIEAEKEGRIADAIKIYEEAIYNNNFPTHHPFDRLGILYRKAKDKENEIRVLKRAIEVFGEESSYFTALDNIYNPKEAIYPKKAEPFNRVSNPLGEQLEESKREFPEFDFYTKTDVAPKFTLKGSSFLTIKNTFKALESEALSYESIKRFDLAAPIYERLISEKTPWPSHYDRLIVIYSKAKLLDGLVRVLETGIDNLSRLRDEQLAYVTSLARNTGRLDYFQDRVSNNKKVTYYNGMFDLYNPYTCISKWEARLSKLKLTTMSKPKLTPTSEFINRL